MTERARYWRRQLDRWERSDLSQVAYCRRGGINAVTFAWWKRKLRAAAGSNQQRGRSVKRAASRKRAHSGPGGSNTSDAKFVEVDVSNLPAAAYEVVLSRDVVIRLPADFDPDKASQLIAVVKAAC